MSTRSCIAKPEGDGWKGRYHHWDGYPTGLGQTLIELHEEPGWDTDRMIRELIDESPGGWSTINGHCEHGELDYSQRYGSDREEWITSADPESQTSIEWVYILTPSGIMVLEGDVGWFGAIGGGNFRNPRMVAWGDLTGMEILEGTPVPIEPPPGVEIIIIEEAG